MKEHEFETPVKSSCFTFSFILIYT